MNSQLNLQLGDPYLTTSHLTHDLHLTNDQMSELLASSTVSGPMDAAQAHLRTCPACAAELASLQDALSLFQEASVAHADREFTHFRNPEGQARRGVPVLPSLRPYSQTLVWVAASALLMAVALPLEMHWQRSLTTPTTSASATAATPTVESDEALLEDVNQDLTRNVPASMQPLDDPTGTSATTATTSIQTGTSTSTTSTPTHSASIQGKD